MSHLDEPTAIAGAPRSCNNAAGGDGEEEKPGRYAKKAVLAASIGYAMDGFDLLILGFALSAVSVDLHLSTTESGSLATITLIGAVVGGLVFGILADRVGRVKVLTYSVVFFAVFTGLTAIATSYAEMSFFRFFAGIGIGGEFGIGMTLAAEAWPKKRRARATSLVALGFQGGVLLAALVSAPVLAVWGWRGLFLIGALPALAAIVFRSRLHEPAQFSRSRQHAPGPGDKTKGSLKLLVKDAATTRSTIGVLVLTSVQNFGYYGLMIWLPTYLSERFGYSLTKSSGWTAVTVVGMGLGILLFGELTDRFGRRRPFWIFQVGAAVSVLAYSQLDSPWALMIGGAVMGLFVNGMTGGYGALMAELYPTQVRATAQNTLFNIGRAVGGFAPVAVALTAGRWGFGLAIGLLSVIYVVDVLAMFLIPDRRGQELT